MIVRRLLISAGAGRDKTWSQPILPHAAFHLQRSDWQYRSITEMYQQISKLESGTFTMVPLCLCHYSALFRSLTCFSFILFLGNIYDDWHLARMLLLPPQWLARQHTIRWAAVQTLLSPAILQVEILQIIVIAQKMWIEWQPGPWSLCIKCI